jgi:outer membrane protein assembly factor BamD (BamD/ComL family)
MSMLKTMRASAAGLVVWGAAFSLSLPVRGQNPAGAPAAQAAKPHAKAVKDQAEYELYNTALKDLAANNSAKAITDLETWKQKYPESDYKDDRELYLVKAYAGAKQPDKALEIAKTLMDRDLTKVFDDPKTGPQNIVQVLFTVVVAAQQIPNLTPDQTATAEKAAHMLMDYNTKPEGVADADWAKAREQMQTAAKGAIMYMAMKPGQEAMQKKDYPAAETAFSKAMQQFPDSGEAAYQLGASEVAQQAKDPNKVSAGIYEIARAAALDPAKGGLADPKARAQVDAYLKKIYTTWHGSDEGLDQLKQQALSSPTPPANFHIKTSTEINTEHEAEFEKTNPQLALWMKIKAQLADTNGQEYFDSQLKGAGVPQLRGTLVDAKPACRSKELLVAVPVPTANGAPQGTLTPEITLRVVDSEGKPLALSGKPELNKEFHWEGIPVEFTREPFMLTMTVDKSKLEGLTVTPCAAAAPARRPATKKK